MNSRQQREGEPGHTSMEPRVSDADLRQLFFILSSVPENYPQEMRRVLDHATVPTKAILTVFEKKMTEASRHKDVPAIVAAWQTAKKHILEREQQNYAADNDFAGEETEPLTETELFEETAAELFGPHQLIKVKGRKVISTRSGGLLWSWGQDIQALLDKRTDREGNKYVRRIKDDYIHLTPEGIVFFNPDDHDRASDGSLVPWSEFRTLIIESNASTIVDPINIKIRPLLRRTAQTSWQPIGSVRITDRGSDRQLVEMRMRRPGEFVDKVKELGAIMAGHLTGVEKGPAEFVEPLTQEMFLSMLSPQLAEVMQNQIEIYITGKKKFSS